MSLQRITKHDDRFRVAVVMMIIAQLSSGLASCTTVEPTRTVAGSGGVSIAYDVAGSGNTALILVHGWSCDRSYWREQVAAFATNYRVITIDLGGHGASPAHRDDWSIESFGQDVAAVANAVDANNLILVGHSMSGPVVLDAALRLGDRVAGIVGVDTHKDVSAGPLSPDRAEAMFSVYAEDFPTKMEALARRVFFTDRTPPALIDRVARDMAAGDAVVARKAGVGMAKYDVRAALRQLDGVPLILINADHGSTDEEALKAVYPDVRVIVIPDSGHFVMLERPAAFNAALQIELDRLSLSE